MFDPTSRYYPIADAQLTVTGSDGLTRIITYKRRRFIPRLTATTTLAEHVVTQGERLDQVAALYVGDPTQFWRIADVNLILDPSDLHLPPGQILEISISTPGAPSR
jgi:hypothetical protein